MLGINFRKEQRRLKKDSKKEQAAGSVRKILSSSNQGLIVMVRG